MLGFLPQRAIGMGAILGRVARIEVWRFGGVSDCFALENDLFENLLNTNVISGMLCYIIATHLFEGKLGRPSFASQHRHVAATGRMHRRSSKSSPTGG